MFRQQEKNNDKRDAEKNTVFNNLIKMMEGKDKEKKDKRNDNVFGFYDGNRGDRGYRGDRGDRGNRGYNMGDRPDNRGHKYELAELKNMKKQIQNEKKEQTHMAVTLVTENRELKEKMEKLEKLKTDLEKRSEDLNSEDAARKKEINEQVKKMKNIILNYNNTIDTNELRIIGLEKAIGDHEGRIKKLEGLEKNNQPEPESAQEEQKQLTPVECVDNEEENSPSSQNQQPSELTSIICTTPTSKTASGQPSSTTEPLGSIECTTPTSKTASGQSSSTTKPLGSIECTTPTSQSASDQPSSTTKPLGSIECTTPTSKTASGQPSSTTKPLGSIECTTPTSQSASDQPSSTTKPLGSIECTTPTSQSASDQPSSTTKPLGSIVCTTPTSQPASDQPSSTTKPLGSIECTTPSHQSTTNLLTSIVCTTPSSQPSQTTQPITKSLTSIICSSHEVKHDETIITKLSQPLSSIICSSHEVKHDEPVITKSSQPLSSIICSEHTGSESKTDNVKTSEPLSSIVCVERKNVNNETIKDYNESFKEIEQFNTERLNSEDSSSFQNVGRTVKNINSMIDKHTEDADKNIVTINISDVVSGFKPQKDEGAEYIMLNQNAEIIQKWIRAKLKKQCIDKKKEEFMTMSSEILKNMNIEVEKQDGNLGTTLERIQDKLDTFNKQFEEECSTASIDSTETMKKIIDELFDIYIQKKDRTEGDKKKFIETLKSAVNNVDSVMVGESNTYIDEKLSRNPSYWKNNTNVKVNVQKEQEKYFKIDFNQYLNDIDKIVDKQEKLDEIMELHKDYIEEKQLQPAFECYKKLTELKDEKEKLLGQFKSTLADKSENRGDILLESLYENSRKFQRISSSECKFEGKCIDDALIIVSKLLLQKNSETRKKTQNNPSKKTQNNLNEEKMCTTEHRDTIEKVISINKDDNNDKVIHPYNLRQLLIGAKFDKNLVYSSLKVTLDEIKDRASSWDDKIDILEYIIKHKVKADKATNMMIKKCTDNVNWFNCGGTSANREAVLKYLFVNQVVYLIQVVNSITQLENIKKGTPTDSSYTKGDNIFNNVSSKLSPKQEELMHNLLRRLDQYLNNSAKKMKTNENNNRNEDKNNAAARIQSMARGSNVRSTNSKKKEAATRIQSMVRGNNTRKVHTPPSPSSGSEEEENQTLVHTTPSSSQKNIMNNGWIITRGDVNKDENNHNTPPSVIDPQRNSVYEGETMDTSDSDSDIDYENLNLTPLSEANNNNNEDLVANDIEEFEEE
jgi:hypothetical protein